VKILTLVPILLALTLAAGGLSLILHVVGIRRKLLAERIRKVAPSRPADTAAEAEKRQAGDALLRVSVKGLDDSDLSEIDSICRRVGIPPKNGIIAFSGARLAAGALLAIVMLAILKQLHLQNVSGALATLTLAPAAVILGWYAPLLLIRRLAKQRAAVVSGGLAEALELLVVCVEAGLTLEDGLERISGELHQTQPMLAAELAMTIADLRVLPNRDQAFDNLAARVPSPTMKSVVSTLSQTLRYGTPLAAALRVAATELRSDSLLALEERANRLPALLTVPMMLFIMPTIFLVVGGPAVLRLMDTFRH
jgi:tight adherence protein C